MEKKEPEVICPGSRAEWRQWLAAHHDKHHAVHLVYYKKQTGKAPMSWSDAVEEALCFGWIDSTRRTLDAERFTQLFTRRKSKSSWSKINKEKVAQLQADGRMMPAGLACIERAKENGSWELLDEVEQMIVPDDLLKALQQYPAAAAYFTGLSKSVGKMMLHWVMVAKKSETREKRIAEIAEAAGRQTRLKQFL